MIINNNAVKIDSNVEPSKALNFGISDVRLVVDILSKLYAYPIRTLVQEYICNGRDAMREAGTWNKLPIEITVPNTLDPVFKVRDFGVGISPDRMENIFVNYGSSTKRNTNTQTGGFGIGAKSAFSYTDSFTVTSFYNGMRYLYVAHLGDEGGVNLISHNQTSQSNGVEISIGVKPKDIPEFKNAIQRCVRFWSEPIKFLGSKDIYQLKPSLTLDNMTVYEGEARTIYLIDGIEYDLMEEERTNYWHRKDNSLHDFHNIVAINIPNGYFKIASSRERLENNDDNKAKQAHCLALANNSISKIVSGLINNKAKKLTERIENKKTYSCFKEVSKTDIDLGNDFKLYKDYVYCPRHVPYRHVRKGRRGSTHKEINEQRTVDLSVIVFTSTDYGNNLARKLNHYLDLNPTKVLVDAKDIANIPHQDILFTNRIDADALPLPPKKTGQIARKTTRDSVCYLIDQKGLRTQWTIERLNNSSDPVVFVDEITEEGKSLSKFIEVFTIPKCNKDLVLKKGMTLEQGKKYLLSKNKDGVLGLDNLPFDFKKVNVLSKFRRMDIGADLRAYLLKEFPDLKKKHDTIKAEYSELVKKYPLITVLNSLGHFSTESSKIVANEINKQSKEVV